MKKIGFIGVGNMGSAILKGVSKVISANDIYIADTNKKNVALLCDEIYVNASTNENIAKDCDYIFLGVKPQVLRDLLISLSPILSNRTDNFVLISMAAGIETSTISNILSNDFPVIRIMPNLPVAVGEGMTLFSPNNVRDEDVLFFENMMSSTGKLLKLPEHLIDAGCSVSGCGPAFVCMVIEALSDGGVKCGLPRDTSTNLAIQTLIGTSKYLSETKTHPAVLKDAVCSPAGSTIAGVNTLEAHGLRSSLIEAVVASFERNKELGR